MNYISSCFQWDEIAFAKNEDFFFLGFVSLVWIMEKSIIIYSYIHIEKCEPSE